MDIKQMISVIQIYIHHNKGVEVNINPDLLIEVPKLLKSYNIAQNWVSNNLL